MIKTTKTVVITEPAELAKGPRVGDIVTERVTAVGPEIAAGGSWDGDIVRIEREVPEPSTTLTIPGTPKMLREALCFAASVVSGYDTTARREAGTVLKALIAERDRHRPLGPDGKHGQLHTATCGCDDVPERYQPDGEWKPGTTGTATVHGKAGVTVMRVQPDDRAPDPKLPWFTDHTIGGWFAHAEGDVTDFVPDDAAALRAEVARLGAAFDDLTEQWRTNNAEADRLRQLAKHRATIIQEAVVVVEEEAGFGVSGRTEDGALTKAIQRLVSERDEALAALDRVRAQIAHEAANDDAITRCNLVAERFQAVITPKENNADD